MERKTKKLEEEIARLEEKKSLCEKEYEEAGRKNDLDALLDLQRKLEEWDVTVYQNNGKNIFTLDDFISAISIKCLYMKNID